MRLFFVFCAALVCAGCATAADRMDWISVGPVYAKKDGLVPAYSFGGISKPWRAMGIIRSPFTDRGDSDALAEYVKQARKIAAQYGADAVVAKVVDKDETPAEYLPRGTKPQSYVWAVAVKFEENVQVEKPVSLSIFGANDSVPGTEDAFNDVPVDQSGWKIESVLNGRK
ncbi:MAG: hypothetical protein WCS77_02760 [Elusimicrobiaceae bacterium]